jgi:hypothetical protein
VQSSQDAAESLDLERVEPQVARAH